MLAVVVIPNFNGYHFLPPCMEALNTQSFSDFGTVVVDNGSSDESYAWLRRWEAEDTDRRHGLYLSQNLGFSEAVNRGIQWAMKRQARYVILLNNDTQVHARFVEELVSFMEADKKERYFACSSRMLKLHDPGLIDDAGDEYTLFGWAFQRALDGPALSQMKRREVFSACAGAAIYRCSALEKTGLFDPLHFAYLEDIDLSYRAQLAGYRIAYLPTAICLHVGSGTSGSKYNRFKVRLSARNSIFVLYKNLHTLQLLLHAPFWLGGILIKQLYFIRLGFGWDYLAGCLDALRQLHRLKKVNQKEVPLLRYLRIEGLLIRGSLSYLLKTVRKHSRKARG